VQGPEPESRRRNGKKSNPLNPGNFKKCKLLLDGACPPLAGWVSESLLQENRAVLWECRAILREYRAFWRENRALLRRYRALLPDGACAFTRGMGE